jgi:hypothetical protein
LVRGSTILKLCVVSVPRIVQGQFLDSLLVHASGYVVVVPDPPVDPAK